MQCVTTSCLVLTAVLGPLGAAQAQTPPPVDPPAWTFEWNARLRVEGVDDAAFLQDADATTLRLRAGVLWQGGGWRARLEGEGIAAGGAYNSGANGRSTLPTIADPQGAEINQALLAWKGAALDAALGRQRLQFDNQRWIGNSGWRQNEQTFDALAFEWQAHPAVALRYAFLARVHRVNGEDAIDPLARERDLSTHLLNARWRSDAQQFVLYGYLHDDHDVPSASTATWGARWTGAQPQGWGWTVEAANQRDHADNPLVFSHTYWLLEPSFARGSVTWRAGWEHLGGNGTHALQTPLATLHVFNGWADKFNVTPPGGLDDRYLGAGGTFDAGARGGKGNWAVAWHDYRADTGGRYGREWNASFGFPVVGPVNALIKFADYRSEGFAFDTRKIWLQLEWAGAK